MSYYGMDYIRDLGSAIRYRDLSYMAEWVYTAKRLPHEWRCMVGMHYSDYGKIYESYYEPPDYGYSCGRCGKEIFPVRIRFQIWLWELPVIRDIIEWYVVRRDQRREDESIRTN